MHSFDILQRYYFFCVQTLFLEKTYSYSIYAGYTIGTDSSAPTLYHLPDTWRPPNLYVPSPPARDNGNCLHPSGCGFSKDQREFMRSIMKSQRQGE